MEAPWVKKNGLFEEAGIAREHLFNARWCDSSTFWKVKCDMNQRVTWHVHQLYFLQASFSFLKLLLLADRLPSIHWARCSLYSSVDSNISFDFSTNRSAMVMTFWKLMASRWFLALWTMHHSSSSTHFFYSYS